MEKCNIVHGVEGPSKPSNKENMHPNEAPVTNENPVKTKVKNTKMVDNLIERLLEV